MSQQAIGSFLNTKKYLLFLISLNTKKYFVFLISLNTKKYFFFLISWNLDYLVAHDTWWRGTEYCMSILAIKGMDILNDDLVTSAPSLGQGPL